MRIIFLSYLTILLSLTAAAQNADRVVQEQCGTMQVLEARLQRSPAFRANFEAQRTRFNRAVSEGSFKLNLRTTDENSSSATNTIPVVFHVVLTNPNSVTDAQVQAQLDTLNKDFGGFNGDSTRIPNYFKSLFGKSSIRFCLAQRTPAGEATSGIERTTTTIASFSTNDAVKNAATGGANAWDSDKYFNVWLCVLSNGILGYSTFPGDGSPGLQGVVTDYRSLPGGSLTNYNTGKTLTHESGHYFNLYHIWGDDNGACTGTDYVDDTPNQSNSTSGCSSGIKTDNCTTSGNGIMYQNFMDYSSDACMVMFTRQQVARMESALVAYRSTLLSSDGCQPPVQRNYDAQLVRVSQPGQRICTGTYTPSITIKNLGIQALTSLTINTVLDNGSVNAVPWTGTLAKSATAEVTLPAGSVTPGDHVLTLYVTSPNNNPDEDRTSDTVSMTFQYYEPLRTVSEGFESAKFAPTAWDIVNAGKGTTWQRVGVSKTGLASAMIDNFDNSAVGEKDDLRLPTLNLAGVDSAYLSFQIAAATYSAVTTAKNAWDTLDVLVSTDCGQTYSSLYKKYGSTLVTTTTASTTSFVPAANQWRKDSVNLIDYISANNLLIAFRNTNGYENNIYLDDINIRTVTINPNLKAKGFMVTPNPTSGVFAVQFYPPPADLRSIQVYNLAGQKVAEVAITGVGSSFYSFNISNYSAGTYVVRAVFADRVVTRKLLKL